MTKREPEIDILATPIWEQMGRWKTEDFYDAQTRQKNLIVWAYHALPSLIKHRLLDTTWIEETESYQDALRQLHARISLLELKHQTQETADFSQQCRRALLEIARFEAYLSEVAESQELDLR